MDPVAFHIGALEIRWYGIMAALGFMGASLLLHRNREKADMTGDEVYDLTFYMMLAGIIGARIYYVALSWDKEFAGNIMEIFKVWHGGLVYYGGFIGGLAMLILYCVWKRKSFLRVMDATAPSLALGHILGRIGCFINGCCYGKACDAWFGFSYPDNYNVYGNPNLVPTSVKLYPVQLFESTMNLVILAVLLFFLNRMKKPGQVAGLYMIMYGVTRFLLEFLRGDNPANILGMLTQAQVIGCVVIPVGIFLLLYRANSKTQNRSR